MIALDAAEKLGCNVPTNVKNHLTGLLTAWQMIYSGDEVPWAKVGYDQVDKPRHRMLLKPAKTLVRQISRLNMAECSVSTEGEERQRFLNDVMRRNRFLPNARKADEMKEALGGVAIKPYVRRGRVVIDFVPPECFVPLSWDNVGIREALFVSRIVERRRYYTKAEIHYFDDNDRLCIDTHLFESQNECDIGIEVALDTLPQLCGALPHLEYDRSEPIFAYIHTPIGAETYNCPLGISRFADAEDVIKACDIAFDELQVERQMAEKMIFASQYMVDRSIDIDGMPKIHYNHDTRVYQILNLDGKDDQMPDTFDPSFKINEHIRDLQIQLDLLCFKTGLDVGSLSFDGNSGVKTATEIRSQNSKTYATVAENQGVLSEAFERLFEAVLWMGGELGFELGLIKPEGAEVKVTFDDSITPDRDTYIKEGVLLVQSGIISKRSFLTEYYGMTEEAAENEISRQAAENQRAAIDLYGGLDGG